MLASIRVEPCVISRLYVIRKILEGFIEIMVQLLQSGVLNIIQPIICVCHANLH